MADHMINIALLQIQAEASIELNMQKGIEYCRRAQQMGAKRKVPQKEGKLRMDKKVIYIGGSPCSGKSTIVKRLSEE